jgi:hypothetical protein
VTAGDGQGVAAEAARTRALQLLTALETDLDMLVDVLDTARQMWSPEAVRSWLFQDQSRWAGRSPIDMIISGDGDAVLGLLERPVD